MLSNTSFIIETTVHQYLGSDKDSGVLIDFLKRYKKNMYIYPNVLQRKFSLSTLKLYEILNNLEKQGILQSFYELYCSNCQKSMGTIRKFDKLPHFFECENCHHNELLTFENFFLIYKIIRDD